MDKENVYKHFTKSKEIAKFWPQEFLRDDLLTELLGDDIHDILYWSGKRLARKHPTNNVDSLISFFNQTNLGTLKLKHQGKDRFEWTLSGSIVEERIKIQKDPDFMFETGFLAQSIEQQLGVVAEGAMNPKKIKKNVVPILVQIDPKNKVSK
ncbi:hypothetical protein WR164_06700 [Philodulcilactobacillus myokoensis]|uniref:DUF2507 domain-containing protein n=1 Tax=Philodulcilactobacillus myokoensis TaxID=2929573 RepID=A0A9W6B0U6_9LACO|nr:YslB family protein [Philodulcilactobacillus myokoensis]GLB46691.1 hypothetical protein WR164_06700 [Philodulcilactobacillus myokoensis]